MAILDVFGKSGAENKRDDKPEDVSITASSKKSAKSAKPVKKETAKSTAGKASVSYEHVLKRPYITEKASVVAEQNVYSFVVPDNANKIEVKKAVKAIYGADAVKVNIVNMPAKNVFSRGKRGVKSAKKKALVYLKKGDTIEFV